MLADENCFWESGGGSYLYIHLHYRSVVNTYPTIYYLEVKKELICHDEPGAGHRPGEGCVQEGQEETEARRLLGRSHQVILEAMESIMCDVKKMRVNSFLFLGVFFLTSPLISY